MMKPVYVRKEDRQKVGGEKIVAGDSRKPERESGSERRKKLEREFELARIRELYLGLGRTNPKKRRMSKFRFSFDWEDTEDTSGGRNSLYQNPHEAFRLLGRIRCGPCCGGWNHRREQEKKMRVDRHWSEKELEDGTQATEAVQVDPVVET